MKTTTRTVKGNRPHNILFGPPTERKGQRGTEEGTVGRGENEGERERGRQKRLSLMRPSRMKHNYEIYSNYASPLQSLASNYRDYPPLPPSPCRHPGC